MKKFIAGVLVGRYSNEIFAIYKKQRTLYALRQIKQ